MADGVSFISDAVDDFLEESVPVMDLKIDMFYSTLTSDLFHFCRSFFPERFTKRPSDRRDLIDHLSHWPNLYEIRSVIEDKRYDMVDMQTLTIIHWINIMFSLKRIVEMSPCSISKFLYEHFVNVPLDFMPDFCFKIMAAQQSGDKPSEKDLGRESKLLLCSVPFEHLYPLLSSDWDPEGYYNFSEDLKHCLTHSDFERARPSSLLQSDVKTVLIVEMCAQKAKYLFSYPVVASYRRELGGNLKGSCFIRYLLIVRKERPKGLMQKSKDNLLLLTLTVLLVCVIMIGVILL